MPDFLITSPDGTKYQVSGPEGSTEQDALAHLQSQLGQSAPVTASGLAKSAGVGVGEGAIGLAGLPGDLAEYGARGIDRATQYIGGKLGVDVKPRADRAPTYGSADITKAVEGQTGGFYKPQNKAEQWANTAGSFAPLVASGSGGIARKVLTNVVAPTVGSESLGALTEGTDLEPYAKGAGALIGGAAASRVGRALDARTAANALPTVDELKQSARGQYQHQDVTNVRIQPSATSRLADTIENDLQHGPNSGFRAANEPKVFSAIDELRNPQQRAATVADIDNVRQVLGNAAKERDAAGALTRQAVAANRAIDHIDNFLPNLRQADLLAGNAQRATVQLDLARQNWGAAKRAELVQTTRGNAELNAAASHSGANIQNATKQAFKPLAKNDYTKARGYNDAERAALDRVVRGTWTGSAARAAGNLLGGGGGLGMLASGAAGYEAGGLPGALGAGLAGRGLKMIGNRSTANAVNHLDHLLRSRAPVAQQAAQLRQTIAALQNSNSPIAQAILRSIVAGQQPAMIGQPALVAP